MDSQIGQDDGIELTAQIREELKPYAKEIHGQTLQLIFAVYSGDKCKDSAKLVDTAWDKPRSVPMDQRIAPAYMSSQNHVCFALLPQMLSTFNSNFKTYKRDIYPNRLVVRFNATPKAITPELQIEFFELCRKAGLIHKSIPIRRIAKSRILDIDISKLTSSKLFSSLLCLRYPIEQPKVVWQTVHFMKAHPNNSFLRMLLLSHVYNNTIQIGHLLINPYAISRARGAGGSGFGNMHVLVSALLNYEKCLEQFAKGKPFDHEVYDIYLKDANKPILPLLKTKGYPTFKLHNTIAAYSRTTRFALSPNVKTSDLYNLN